MRPHPASGAKLRDLFEDGGAGDEEERKPRGELVDILAGCNRRLNIGDAVGEGECDLLDGGRPGLGHVVPGDGDGVPARDLVAAVGEDVSDEPDRLGRRIDVGTSGDVLLEHVVLDRAAQLVSRDALLLCHQLVEHEEDRSGCIDRHRGRYLIERDLVEQDAHIVDRVDGDAHLADLAVGERMIGVIAHLGRQIERNRQTRRAGSQQLPVALIALDGGAEPRVLAHCPRPTGVHRRVDTARVRELPGNTQFFLGLPAVERLRTVDRRKRQPRLRQPALRISHCSHAPESCCRANGSGRT